MINAKVFSRSGNAPVVIIGDLLDIQIAKYITTGWKMSSAMFNKHGIPIAPMTHKYKHAADVDGFRRN